MQFKKQQLEPDMEQRTGSKLGKEYIKAVYCHPAYLTYRQSTSCEILSCMKHKLESRLQGEISITSGTPKSWCFWTVVLEKTLERPLALARRFNQSILKEISPEYSWEGLMLKAETPILWPPGVKSWLPGKDPDARQDWRQEEKGPTEDEMVGWHHQLDRHESERVPGVGDGEGSLACCSPWGHKESDMTELLNWAKLEAQMVKNPLAVLETCVRYLGWEDTPEKGTATHSSILAWRIAWTEEPGRLQSQGCKDLDIIERLSLHISVMHGTEKKWTGKRIQI